MRPLFCAGSARVSIDFSFKSLGGFAGQVGAAALNTHDQVAAGQLYCDVLALGALAQLHRRAAAAQAPVPQASVSPFAALVDAQFDHALVDHAREPGVDALGEDLRVFKQRPDHLQVQRVHALDERHAVGIAQG